MKTSTFRAFSAGVSLLTLGMALPAFTAPAFAQQGNNGSRQQNSTNLYTVPGTYTPPPGNPVSGDDSPDRNGDPGDGAFGLAQTAIVTCADEQTCAAFPNSPGAIWQTGVDVAEVLNTIRIFEGNFLTVEAFASGAGLGGGGAFAQIATDAIRQLGTAPSVVNTIDNQGTINVRVFADDLGAGSAARAILNGAVAPAGPAAGIRQTATAASGTNSILNSGDINIDVIANAEATAAGAVAFASLTGAGIDQAIGGDATEAANLIENDGDMDIIVGAFADGVTTGRALSTLNLGIEQTAVAFETASNDLTVGDNLRLDIGVIASALAETAAATASAELVTAAIRQSADADSASVSIFNTGTLEIRADAIADSDAAGASATALIATGVDQVATGDLVDGVASARIENEGGGAFSLNIYSVADARGVTSANGSASIMTGVSQIVSAADASVIANGPIDVIAIANVIAEDGPASGTAALAVGIDQSAVGLDRAVVGLGNDGIMDVGAIINASGNSVDADADLGIGISQFASATAIDGIATVNLTNNDVLNVFAEVDAFADGAAGAAAASAAIDTGIVQIARGAPNEGNLVAIDLTNNNLMSVRALADASALDGTATANATMAAGIYQSIAAATGVALEGGESVSISLQNNGNIDILARAGASKVAGAGAAVAAASITSAGLYQFASGADTASVSIVNGAGILNIEAEAIARATAANATADAGIGSNGIYQSAIAADGDANASIVNAGVVNVIADASAVANVGQARATATIGTAVSQFAYGDIEGTATLMIDNSGASLNIVADANADGETFADASAVIGAGIYQTGTGQDVFATIQGPINVVAIANAFAENGVASANATIGSAGLYQGAYAEETGSASIDLEGERQIAAIAIAEGDFANATANMGYGIFQSATADGDPDARASASINNSGSLDITVYAAALADVGAANADARLTNAGIYQSATAEDGGSASVNLVNAGTIDIRIAAYASGDEGAQASARITEGTAAIYQFAESDSATVNLVSSGRLSILADARAYASDLNATANASISFGVTQSASGEDYRRAELANTDRLDVLANAVAFASEGSAVADASIQTGIIQRAVAGEDSATASVDISNSGFFGVRALADGDSLDSGSAFADATIGTGILQRGRSDGGDGSSTIRLENEAGGEMVIVARADADADGLSVPSDEVRGQSSATITLGIAQLGNTDGGEGINTKIIDNAGVLAIAATAGGTGTEGYGFASATVVEGIRQVGNANGGSGTIDFSLNNTGTLYIGAEALSAGDLGAGAIANVGVDGEAAINQVGRAEGGTIGIDLTNEGDLSVRAFASALGTEGYGSAEAFIGNGIRQRAGEPGVGAETASLMIDNDGGNIFVGATAIASAETGRDIFDIGYGNATVEQGIVQRAEGDSASAMIANSGSITIQAISRYTGESQFIASADAEIDRGIFQRAFGDGTASVSLGTTGGTTNVLATGIVNVRETSSDTIDFTGPDAFIDVAIDQFASAGGEDGDATVNFDGAVNIQANAIAMDVPESATVLTSIGEATVLIGIFQSAEATEGVDARALVSANLEGGSLIARAQVSASESALANGVLGSISGNPADPFGAIDQNANGSELASIELTNSGEFDFYAVGSAFAAGEGNAFGTAQVIAGIDQRAFANTADGSAVVNFENGGPVSAGLSPAALTPEELPGGVFTLAALANAVAPQGDASANAILGAVCINGFGAEGAICGQAADFPEADEVGGSSSAQLVNSGDVVVPAVDESEVDFGTVFNQSATGNTATVNIGNASTINILANADAEADGEANAAALIGVAVNQDAFGQDIGSATIRNVGGELSIAAIAEADGGTAADAQAFIFAGVSQQAFANGTDGSAFALIEGPISVVADAEARATDGTAIASATINFALFQLAVAPDGTATVSFANDGVMTIGAFADATAAGGDTAVATDAVATANAFVDGLYYQAIGESATINTVNSGGDINIFADANANGVAFASANATVTTGIFQSAQGEDFASVNLENGFNRNINIVADADANATTGTATANAIVNLGIEQIATGIGGGTPPETASVTLTNSGTVNIVADAFANADEGGANAEARIVGNADGADGVNQRATGFDSASVVLDNTGGEAFTLNIIANALAIGQIGATATASVGTGIAQVASASDTDASASVLLNGPVRVIANAAAILETGGALANADVNNGIGQVADGNGGDFAGVRLTNDGVMAIGAGAFASGDDAEAIANLGSGITQSAFLNTAEAENGTASADIANTGSIDIFARAVAVAEDGNATADADMVTGISQQATGMDLATVTFNNSGTLMIEASAVASADLGVADASATIVNTGIFQQASGVDEARAALVNSGTLDIQAMAVAIGDTANASANAGSGIYQSANASGVGGLADVSLINNGSLDVQARASAIADVGAATAEAFVAQRAGIYQSAIANDGDGTALLSIDNNGSLAVRATALANGETDAYAYASVSYIGVQQSGFADTVSIGFTNNGTMDVTAQAQAISESGDVSASATIYSAALFQFGSGTDVSLNFANGPAGDVEILSLAVAQVSEGNASAQAFGAFQDFGLINQEANGADTASVSISNAGSIDILTRAEARAGDGDAFASATIGTGIGQLAQGISGGPADTATVTLSSTGSLSLAVEALAVSDFGAATAEAQIETFGVRQQALGFNSATVVLDTGDAGGLTIEASAVALAEDAAVATATIATGLFQSASATDLDGEALVSIEGPVNVLVRAFASAQDGPANATVTFDTGIVQIAQANETSTVRLDNNGTMTVGAFALASGTLVNADASFNVGINQEALGVGGGVPQEARVEGINVGTIDVVAEAIAIGQTTASASALFETGVRQFAEGFDTGTIMFDNTGGALSIRATASADAPSNALAVAEFENGVLQDAIATGTLGDAMASLVGPVNAEATAIAIATTGTAEADARVVVGINQEADAPDRATANFANSGSMSIGAFAFASGEELANADASLVIGIFQSADFSFGVPESATVGFANSGSISLFATAVATADDDATAYANIETGIYQAARGGSFGSIDGLGTGSIDIAAMALAEGGASADAEASLETGVYQTAQGEDFASVSLGGEGGSLSIAAMASADAGTGDADADAFVETGLYQVARAFGEDGEARVSFTGMLDVTASAVANSDGGAAAADATLERGASQSASATAGTAVVSMDLEGGSIIANAIASGEDNASALAFISTAINQIASGEELASVALTNTGGLNLAVNAEANADGDGASANATAVMEMGINQEATADDEAFASIVNNGTVDVIVGTQVPGPVDGTLLLGAFAQATSVSGDASANAVIGGSCDLAGEGVCDFGGEGPILTVFADGLLPMLDVDDIDAGLVINQDVTANNAQANFVNSGTINVIAMATANAGVGDDADAFAFVGIAARQEADGLDTATVSLDNTSGELNVTALAQAFGGIAAEAEAFIQTGVFQTAFASEGDANVSLTGPVSVMATANATATAMGGDAQAFATVENAVVQTANGVGGSADVSYDVDGDQMFRALAVVTANQGAATATADIDGIEQDAVGNTASVSLTNNGSLTVQAIAAAFGTEAVANANVTYGVSQEVTAVETGSASLDNVGSIEIGALASGRGTVDDGTADAFVDDGITQFVRADTATVSLTSSGSIGVTASANAAGVDRAYASADVNYGVSQSASGVEFGSVAFTSNDLEVMAIAVADGEQGATAAAALITGVFQYAEGDSATASLDSTGSINIAASGSANSGVGVADAFASIVEAGIYQYVSGGAFGTGSIDLNGGMIAVVALATGEQGALAEAQISDSGAVYQQVNGDEASASFNSSGTLTIMADAGAQSDQGDATAVATVNYGLQQYAVGSDTATAAVAIEDRMQIVADADARAGAFADAFAEVGIGIFQSASAFDASVSLTNSDTLLISAEADAVAALGAVAFAEVTGIVQEAFGGSTAAVTLDNDGVIGIAAEANATAGNVAVDDDATATAFAFGIIQAANGVVFEAGVPVVTPGVGVAFPGTETAIGSVSISLTNSGNVSVIADASANADNFAFASAFASGVSQEATGIEASVTLANDAGGVIQAGASAAADGGTGAEAFANVFGIEQSAIAGDAETLFTNPLVGPSTFEREVMPVGPATVSLTNGGTILVSANADATAGEAAATPFAIAAASATGIAQLAHGTDASVNLANAGVVGVSANADVVGASQATASATVIGIGQSAIAAELVETFTFLPGGFVTEEEIGDAVGEASASLTNSGTVAVNAAAVAEGGTSAGAVAGVVGIEQGAVGETATLLLTNSARIDVDGVASASGTNAFASAAVGGVVQAVAATDGALTFNSTGTVSVDADANATGTATGTAMAHAVGVAQAGFGDEVDFTFNEAGTFLVDADANATGDEAFASASANGYVAIGNNVNLTLSNTGGVMQITADANAHGGTAIAYAAGVSVSAIGDGGDGALTGTINNANTLLVQADAEGAGGTATATGIHLTSGSNNATLTNTGTIMVTALTDDGSSTATGILVENNGTENPAGGDVFTINNNGGVIMARISTDDGDTFQRGMAIDVHDSPNKTQINLRGAGTTPGQIYGNIDLQAGDNILVTGGETRFDGIINPEFAPQPLNQDPSPTFQGTLTIANGGNLFLRDNSRASNADFYDGPSQAYVNTLTVQDGATLTYELFAGPSQEESEEHYPQIFANTANLNGTLAVRPINLAPNGLFDDEYYFDNIIEADVRNGQFDNLVLEGFTLGALLNFEIIYDGQNNVDLGLTRTAFGQLGDETDNQAAVGAGLEAVYDFTLTGEFADMLSTFFTLDADEYYDALDQISGVEYPNYLHSLRNNTFTNNMFVNDQLDCAIDIRGVDACRDQESGPRFWVLGTYNDQKLDSTANFMGYDAGNWAGLLGVDYRFGNGFSLGVFGGYRSLDLDFRDRPSNNVEADGWQAGLTAAYDVGNFYIRAVGSYSTLNGESRREIDFGGFGGQAQGEPDAKVWSIYGEAGARFDLGGSWVTPFVGVDHTSIELEGFTETGVGGANLELDDQTEKQTSILGGLKWTGNFGGIVPEAKVAYRHDFGDGALGVDMRFADAPAGSDFRKVERYDRNSIIAGLSLAGVLSDRITGRLGYQGRFNDEVTDHAFYGSLTFKFGGAAPAPAPEPAPLPPPPPPPAAEPTPPPPAAVPVGPFIVFFDWDRDEITPQAAAILDNAAAQYAQTGQAQVMIAGHADRSGSAQYNVGLSQRRAANVRSYLAGRGIPDGVMATEAFGESRPLVETADGVREPQNRRVEIAYGPGAGS